MMLIGIDPHKSTHTATAVDPGTNRDQASIRIDGSLQEYQRMLDWVRQWPQRRWAVENARGLGHHLTSWLLARGEQVVDVPPSATARVRQLSRAPSTRQPCSNSQPENTSQLVNVASRLSSYAFKPCASSEGPSGDSDNWRNWDDW
ncbi:transposase [Streptomyces sp. 5-10]|uniref:IS110 family transposase n=1 Tax=Streptomyces sp. 5-10 TaxID=878925 RepID=UPI00295E6184|nr:transposase [Streptomyces sp. 5-10]